MLPIRITYHGLDASDSLNELIHARAAQIERLHDRLQGLRVLVDAPHHHQRHGKRYRVRLELGLPGYDLVVGHDQDEHVVEDDAYQSVRHAFDALRRKLRAQTTRRHGKQRAHFARAL